eukprot:3846-Heterococcus_DN1.PRE.2
MIHTLHAPLLLHIVTFLASDVLHIRATCADCRLKLDGGDKEIWAGRTSLLALRYEDAELYSQQQHWTEYTAWGGHLMSYKELYFWAKRILPFLGVWALSDSVQGALLVVRVQANGIVAATSVRPRLVPHGPLDAAVDFESMQVCKVVPAVRSRHTLVMAPLPKRGEKAIVLDATVRPDSMFATETAITLLVNNEQEPLRQALRVSMLDITQGVRSVLSFRKAPRTTAAASIRSLTDTTGSTTAVTVTPAAAAAAATAVMTAGATASSEHAETAPLMQNFPDGVTGMYWAVYGPHGFELINVSWCANSGVLLGQKITGDVNVPASQATFETTGPFIAATANDTQQQQQQQQCQCMFGCECFNGTPGNTGVVYGHMEARAKTAGTGYHNPAWNRARIVFFDAADEWNSNNDMHPMRAQLRGRVIASITAPANCSTARAECRVGVLLQWLEPDFRTSTRLRPFFP